MGEGGMKYRGILRVSLNNKEFCFVDMRCEEGKRNSYYQQHDKKMFTNKNGQPLTIKKSVLNDENPYIDFDPNEEGFKINYMDDLRSEGFIDALIKEQEE